ncbi:hypothetical protein I4U23_012539 [Adineta vaga]|nr:hypothetical protein I4U23_012539 [Adineta vaga]
MTIFETLPNEILIEIFEYFNGFDIFLSFNQLNSRLNHLIRTIPIHLNFQHIHKTLFDQFCLLIQSNSSIKQQISSLILSNKDTCGQIDLFLSNFSLKDFPILRSLTFIQIEQQNINQIKSILPFLVNLQTFRLLDLYDLTNEHNEIISLLPLSNLRYLSISSLTFIKSQSNLTYLTVSGCTLDQLFYQFFEHIPLLKYLKIENIYKASHSIKNHHCSIYHRAFHLKQMIINNYEYLFDEFEIFVQLLPNLQQLTISALDNLCMIDAQRWEVLIKSSLKILRTFQFIFGLYCRGQLFYTFDQLNNRFSQLIRRIPLQLNLQHVQKHLFDEFCLQLSFYPEIKQQIHSLYLSNRDSTGQIERFLTSFPLQDFSHLQFLTLTDIDQANHLQLTSMLPLASSLRSFCMSHTDYDHEILTILPMSNLQQLSILSFHSIQTRINDTLNITKLTILSCLMDDLFYHLFDYFPQMQYLHHHYIRDLQAFQNEFWWKEHQWYVEYSSEKYLAEVYTIPYPSRTMQINLNTKRYPGKIVSNVFDQVKYVTLNHEVVNENCQYYFSKIHTLELLLHRSNVLQPMKIEDLRRIVNLNCLKHLNISQYGRMLTCEFMFDLLKQSVNLSWITINPEDFLILLKDDELCQDLNRIIRKMDILKYGHPSFKTSEDMRKFCAFFSNIEQLTCYVMEPNDVFTFLNHLTKLSTIDVCFPATMNYEPFVELFDEQSQKFNYTYRVESMNPTKLSMWIGKRMK